jgi:hypothetical protein
MQRNNKKQCNETTQYNKPCTEEMYTDPWRESCIHLFGLFIFLEEWKMKITQEEFEAVRFDKESRVARANAPAVTLEIVFNKGKFYISAVTSFILFDTERGRAYEVTKEEGRVREIIQSAFGEYVIPNEDIELILYDLKTIPSDLDTYGKRLANMSLSELSEEIKDLQKERELIGIKIRNLNKEVDNFSEGQDIGKIKKRLEAIEELDAEFTQRLYMVKEELNKRSNVTSIR